MSGRHAAEGTPRVTASLSALVRLAVGADPARKPGRHELVTAARPERHDAPLPTGGIALGGEA